MKQKPLTYPMGRALTLLKRGRLVHEGRSYIAPRDRRARFVSHAVVGALRARKLVLYGEGSRYVSLSHAGQQAAKALPQICRRCGCSEFRPCPAGCAWAEPDLCSACV